MTLVRCFDPSGLDLGEIATALAHQTDYEHRWLINTQTGEIVFWTSDTGIDGQTPVDLDELDLICIDPLPSYIWYQDMADFGDQISDERAGRRLARALPKQDTAIAKNAGIVGDLPANCSNKWDLQTVMTHEWDRPWE